MYYVCKSEVIFSKQRRSFCAGGARSNLEHSWQTLTAIFQSLQVLQCKSDPISIQPFFPIPNQSSRYIIKVSLTKHHFHLSQPFILTNLKNLHLQCFFNEFFYIEKIIKYLCLVIQVFLKLFMSIYYIYFNIINRYDLVIVLFTVFLQIFIILV